MGILSGSSQRTPFECPRDPVSIFQQRLPIDDGQLHFLVPAGVGDNLWIISKLWNVCQQRDVTFWLPADEQKRSGDVFRMMGLKHGYMPNLTTEWIWSRPGSPPIPDTGAVLSIQPNRHLEHGHRIEKWYPELEFKNPVQFMDTYEVPYKQVAGKIKYVVVFTSQMGYMETGGNLKPAQWARIFNHIEEQVAPTLLIGAGKDVAFCYEVMKFFDPKLEPVLNASLDTVASLMSGAEMVIGAHAGPLILSTYMGIPTLHGYPRWLFPMPGTWEHPDNTWGACFLDELENVMKSGVEKAFTGCAATPGMRNAMLPSIKSSSEVHPRWRNYTIPELAEMREKNGGHVTEEEIREGASSG